ncbi:hypothetical protein IFM89_034811 [Coptis chinensis]|uniref:non-specific serine/threonine protein kinase n=1 Tax=Coptis chinensis TaxID=261450 RepID=A0A835HAY3_9MAGN|nr:hypothetical protein IFM89_034811 [Coptis chinensis]
MTDDQSICNFSVSHPCLVSINSSNVLLDEKFVAKISEVGLLCSTESHIASSLNSRARGNICTVLAVTHSCIDKEGKDVVFQLGVLILELITGQSEKEGTDLVLWVQGFDLAHSVSRMIDPDVENSYNSKELRRLLTVARLCTKSRGKQTCSFQQILRFLQGISPREVGTMSSTGIIFASWKLCSTWFSLYLKLRIALHGLSEVTGTREHLREFALTLRIPYFTFYFHLYKPAMDES